MSLGFDLDGGPGDVLRVLDLERLSLDADLFRLSRDWALRGSDDDVRRRFESDVLNVGFGLFVFCIGISEPLLLLLQLLSDLFLFFDLSVSFRFFGGGEGS